MLAAIEVSTRICSVALLDMMTGEVVNELTLPGEMESSQTLIPALEEMLRRRLLTPEDLAAVAVSVGPGSFTGIRVGLSTAQGLCLPGGIPAYGISSLDGLAENLREGGWEGETLALVDAQRGECFVGHYQVEAGNAEILDVPRIMAPADFGSILQGRAWIVGPGALKHEKAIREALGAQAMFAMTAFHQPQASSVARLAFRRWQAGERPKAEELEPLYLRPPAVEEQHQQDSSA
jgi:tRNA threonylcarbamoyladenosine biosynthesis protein TsaB